MPRFDLNNYVPVQERITEFWKDHPDGAIRTSLASDQTDWKHVRYHAEVFTHRDHDYPDATGYAFEIAGGGGANSTSHEENCETSAIGRALANLGYATSAQKRPSREEMAKANGDTARAASAPQSAPQAPQRPANVTTLPAPSLETRNTVLEWLTKNNVAPDAVLSALGTASMGDWLKANPGEGWAGLKKVVEDAVFPAPAEATP
jgi:hypothetical protein